MDVNTLNDLCKLATARVHAAIGSVDQLIEDDEETLRLLMAVLASLMNSTAQHMQATGSKPDGTKMTDIECYCAILRMLAAIQDIETQTILDTKP